MEVSMDNQERKKERAKKQLDKIKGFYNHLGVYIIINTLLQIFYTGAFGSGDWNMYTPFWARLITPVSWGIGLTIHGIVVFYGHKIRKPWKEWEDRKIKKIMEEEEEREANWK